MSQCLHPCPSCARHLRAAETACPFCDAALPPGWGVCTQPAARGRPMSRAALLFVGATAVTSCGGTTAAEPADGGGREATTDSGSDSGTDSGGDDLDGAVVLYGPATIDAGPRQDATPDAPGEAATDAGYDGTAVMYGPAPVDGG